MSYYNPHAEPRNEEVMLKIMYHDLVSDYHLWISQIETFHVSHREWCYDPTRRLQIQVSKTRWLLREFFDTFCWHDSCITVCCDYYLSRTAFMQYMVDTYLRDMIDNGLEPVDY